MKTIYQILMAALVLFLTQGFVFAQEESEEEDCWCKREVNSGGDWITIQNIDSLVHHDDPDNSWWRNLEGCDDPETDCKEQTCTFEQKVCKMIDGVKVCNFEPQEGECTDDTFGEGIPWDTTGVEPGDCECIWQNQNNNYTGYGNVSRMAESNPEMWVILEDCEGEDCEKNVCRFKKKHPRTGEWSEHEGFCTEYWPNEEEEKPEEENGLQQKTQLGQSVTDEGISFYPNPSNSHIYIQSSEAVHTVIMDMRGKVILESEENKIDLSTLAKGSYIIVLKSESEFKKDRLIFQ